MTTDGPRKTKTIVLDGIAIGEVEATGDLERDLLAARAFLKERGLERKTSTQRTMFGQAVAFCAVAAQLHERGLAKPPHDPLTIAPFVVNAAFSIELYLKTLLHIHGVAAKKLHELTELYSALPASVQSRVNALAERDAPLYGVRLADEGGLQSIVNHLNNSFVEWRYLYEKERTGVVRIQPTILLMKALHDTCRESVAT